MCNKIVLKKFLVILGNNIFFSETLNIYIYSRDLDAMAKVAEAEPVYIELLSKYSTPQGPIAGQTRVTLRNEHISYIITWYGLFVSTGYMWFRYFVQKLPLV